MTKEEPHSPEYGMDDLAEKRDSRDSFHRQFTNVSQDSTHTDKDSHDDALAPKMEDTSAATRGITTDSTGKVKTSSLDCGVDGSGHSLIEEDSDHAIPYSSYANSFASQYHKLEASDDHERVSI